MMRWECSEDVMDDSGRDLVGRLMADMDPRLLEFLQTKVTSFVKWDL